MSESPPKKPHKPAMWYRYMDASSLGIEIAVSVVIGAAAGIWLERNVTHWAPWTSVLGMMLGVATAARAIVRTARSYTKQLRDQAAYEAALGETADDTTEPEANPEPSSPSPRSPEGSHTSP